MGSGKKYSLTEQSTKELETIDLPEDQEAGRGQEHNALREAAARVGASPRTSWQPKRVKRLFPRASAGNSIIADHPDTLEQQR